MLPAIKYENTLFEVVLLGALAYFLKLGIFSVDGASLAKGLSNEVEAAASELLARCCESAATGTVRGTREQARARLAAAEVETGGMAGRIADGRMRLSNTQWGGKPASGGAVEVVKRKRRCWKFAKDRSRESAVP